MLAQGEIENTNYDPSDKLTPPSPNASSLGKYGEMPVSLATGTPQISVPLGSAEGRNLSLPLSLNYHASGIKVDEVASQVGLGWSLQAGGLITRTVRGKPDETDDFGFFDIMPASFANIPVGEYYDIPLNPNPVCVDDFMERAAKGTFDTQPDLFAFNFGGYQGKFVFDIDGQIHVIPKQDIQIKMINQMGGQKAFEAITPDGIKYLFGGEEATEITTTNNIFCESYFERPTQTFASAWYLTDIIHPNEEVIHLDYEKYGTIRYYNSIDQSKYIDIQQYSPQQICANPPNDGLLKTCVSLLEVEGVHLTTISTSKEQVELEYIQQDGGEDARKDLEGGVRLEHLRFYDLSQNLLRRFSMDYDFFESSNCPTNNVPNAAPPEPEHCFRLKLKSVTEHSLNDAKPPYEFNYLDEISNQYNLPSRLSFSQDHWGFYNGQNNTHLLPSLRETPDFLNGANRDPHAEHTKANMLYKITFPTGGHQAFEYEVHDFQVGSIPYHLYESYWVQETVTAHDIYNQSTTNEAEFTLDQAGYVDVLVDIPYDSQYQVESNAEVRIFQRNGANLILKANYGLSSVGLNQLLLPEGEFILKASAYIPGDTAYASVYYENQQDILIDDLENPPYANLLVGGTRIKKTIMHDGQSLANDQIKSYEYTQGMISPISSGKVVNLPRYTHFMQEYRALYAGGFLNAPYGVACKFMGVSSNSKAGLGSTQGSPIMYTEVKVLEGESGAHGLSQNRFSYQGDRGGRAYPFGPATSYDWKRGHLLEQCIYKKENDDFIPVQKQVNIYDFREDKTMGNSSVAGLSVGIIGNTVNHNCDFLYRRYAYDIFHVIAPWYYIDSTILYKYDALGENPIITTTDFDFDEDFAVHTQAIRSEINNSDGTKYVQETTYSKDLFPVGDESASGEEAKAIRRLSAQNQIIPIQTIHKIKKQGSTEKVVEGTLHTFQNVSDHLSLPNKTFQIETDNPLENFNPASLTSSHEFIFDPRFRERGQITSVSPFGQIQSFKSKDNFSSSIIYGHDFHYPVAKIQNAETHEVAYTSFEVIGDYGSENNGGWEILPQNTGGWNSSSDRVKTGKVGFNIGADREVKFEVQTGGKYLISYWQKSGTSTISNADVVLFQETSNAWTYVQKEIHLGSESILKLEGDNSNFYIDELRLHPIDALMETICYDPKQGNSITYTNQNGRSQHFEYDEFQRLILSKDFEGNLVSHSDYTFSDEAANGYNQTRTILFQKENVAFSEDFQYQHLDASFRNMHVTYTDGLGRILQQIEVAQSPTKNDVIQLQEYDKFGKQSKVYLPYSMPTNYGEIRSNPSSEQSNFYLNTSEISTTNYPSSNIQFESSPLYRVKEISEVGFAWRMGGGHTVKLDFRPNLINEVFNYKTGNYYPPSSLWMESKTDENGKLKRKFIDQLGRVILSQEAINDTWASTYNLYDDKGNINVVIPPLAVEQLGMSIDLSTVENLLFRYRYDERNRIIEKQMPNAEPSYFVYNTLDQLILKQHGNHRLDHRWTFNKFDRLGRKVMTGICTLSGTRSSIQTAVNNQTSLFEIEENQLYSVEGYSNVSYPILTANDEVLTVNFYDDYSINEGQTIGTSLVPVTGISLGAPSRQTKGLATFSKVKILDESNTFLWTFNYYNDRGQLIQQQVDHHLGGKDIFSNAYDFVGNRIKNIRLHQVPNKPDLKIAFTYEYDHANRLINTYSRINKGDNVRISNLRYNELGQLIEKNLHATNFDDQTNSINYLQSLDFTYNVRGWLKSINQFNFCTDEPVLTNGLTKAKSNDIQILLNKNELNEGVQSKIKIEDQTQLFEDQDLIIEQQNERLKIIEEEPNNTILQDQISIDLSDQEIESHRIASSLETLEERLNLQLDTVGIVNEISRAIVKQEVLNAYRDTWSQIKNNADQDDLFALRIEYTTGNNSINAPAQFDGKISVIQWQSPCENKKTYGFQYDDLNRLSQANYKEYKGNGMSEHIGRYSVPNIQYDLAGNIITLQRNGMNGLSISNNPLFGNIDHLNYSYQGNQLKKIVDQSQNSYGFTDDNNQEVEEYGYDANGNLVIDKNKNISILYNHLDLPEMIVWEDGKKTIFTYDAQGNKISKKTIDNFFNITGIKDYVGGIEYFQQNLESIYHPEGRIVPLNNASIGAFRYEYVINDHLGNARIHFSDLNNDGSIDKNTEVLQENHYYPFGLRHEGLQDNQVGITNPYQYNGKEFIADHNLDWLDYGFRYFDAQIGRWHNIDPMSEWYLNFSPYNYVGNDPINYIDPNGMYRKKKKAERMRNRALKNGYQAGDVYYSKGDKKRGQYIFTFGRQGEHWNTAVRKSDFGPNGGGFINWVQSSFSTAGFIPGLGVPFDLANSAISSTRGILTGENSHYLEATISGFSAIPLIGDLGKGAIKAKKVSSSLSTINNSQTLYRAVSKAELDDILKYGLRTKGDTGYESAKLFAPTLLEATKFGKNNYTFDKIPNFLIKVEVPQSIFNKATKFSADGMNAISISADQLHLLRSKPINFSPFVK